jgi:ssDNA thymidine ADP-ribosyltransferase, DarT
MTRRQFNTVATIRSTMRARPSLARSNKGVCLGPEIEHEMPPYPEPTPIFHITALDNVRSIAQTGAILSRSLVAQQGLVSSDMAYQHIQGRRAVRRIPIPPGGTLHDYVPFYFAPRSPMLFTINNGNVPGCDYRQDDIAHLVVHAQAVLVGRHRFVFSDIHAALDYARFFDDLAQLAEIDWRIFFELPQIEGYCKYWQNRHGTPHHVCRLETRQAEFLVHQSLPIAAVSEIGVRTAAGAARVLAALGGTGWNPTVRVVPGWYF